MKPKALIIRTAGTNCDKETEFAFQSAGAETSLFHINYLKQRSDFSDFQIVCIPGGFSYGDDLGAGKILSLELISWFKDALKQFIDKGGLILGICNGFQVLVKTGILPDKDFQQKVTLTDNDSGRFEDRWVYLKVENEGVWLKGLDEKIVLPVAHGEGKFYTESGILD
ncbi:MAG: phosphoribosylformylglycinamidine synthase subunit PurQ, partial [Candidatus Omnitrophica bacterium]|nr:phosphoribosylformylglycinamidine synthase subunit PurQ [Candidatus Omnitrophota bacterium]